MIPHRSPYSAFTTRRLILAMLAVLTAVLLVAPASSQALRLEVRSGTASALAVKLDGARAAKAVSFYVDGKLRVRDHRRPWKLRRTRRVRLSPGRHTVVARARFGYGSLSARRTVLVAKSHVQRARARSARIAGSHRENRATAPPHHVVSEPPVEETPPSEPEPEPEPEPSLGPISDWHGDFETGNLSQWEVVQEVAPDRITVTHDPVRQGNYAARFEVRPGDNIGDTPPRAELATDLHEKEGEERYYRWYTYFDPSFPTEYPNSFITFTQWRAKDESGAYTSFMVWGDQIELRREGTKWSAPLTKGVWHKFVYHVKWSPDPNVGFIELYYDGQLVLPKTYVRTMAGTPGHAIGNYVKEGLYKSEEIPTGVLYQDGFVAETSFAAANEAQ